MNPTIKLSSATFGLWILGLFPILESTSATRCLDQPVNPITQDDFYCPWYRNLVRYVPLEEGLCASASSSRPHNNCLSDSECPTDSYCCFSICHGITRCYNPYTNEWCERVPGNSEPRSSRPDPRGLGHANTNDTAAVGPKPALADGVTSTLQSPVTVSGAVESTTSVTGTTTECSELRLRIDDHYDDISKKPRGNDGDPKESTTVHAVSESPAFMGHGRGISGIPSSSTAPATQGTGSTAGNPGISEENGNPETGNPGSAFVGHGRRISGTPSSSTAPATQGTGSTTGNPGISEENGNPETGNPGISEETGYYDISEETDNPGISEETGNPGVYEETGKPRGTEGRPAGNNPKTDSGNPNVSGRNPKGNSDIASEASKTFSKYSEAFEKAFDDPFGPQARGPQSNGPQPRGPQPSGPQARGPQPRGPQPNGPQARGPPAPGNSPKKAGGSQPSPTKPVLSGRSSGGRNPAATPPKPPPPKSVPNQNAANTKTGRGVTGMSPQAPKPTQGSNQNQKSSKPSTADTENRKSSKPDETQSGNRKPDEIENRKSSKPDDTESESRNPSKPDASENENRKPSKPDASEDENRKPSKPDASENENRKPSKPDASENENRKPSKPTEAETENRSQDPALGRGLNANPTPEKPAEKSSSDLLKDSFFNKKTSAGDPFAAAIARLKKIAEEEESNPSEVFAIAKASSGGKGTSGTSHGNPSSGNGTNYVRNSSGIFSTSIFDDNSWGSAISSGAGKSVVLSRANGSHSSAFASAHSDGKNGSAPSSSPLFASATSNFFKPLTEAAQKLDRKGAEPSKKRKDGTTGSRPKEPVNPKTSRPKNEEKKSGLPSTGAAGRAVPPSTNGKSGTSGRTEGSGNNARQDKPGTENQSGASADRSEEEPGSRTYSRNQSKKTSRKYSKAEVTNHGAVNTPRTSKGSLGLRLEPTEPLPLGTVEPLKLPSLKEPRLPSISAPEVRWEPEFPEFKFPEMQPLPDVPPLKALPTPKPLKKLPTPPPLPPITGTDFEVPQVSNIKIRSPLLGTGNRRLLK